MAQRLEITQRRTGGGGTIGSFIRAAITTRNGHSKETSEKNTQTFKWRMVA